MWGDHKFRSLSRPSPSAQTLWFYLLTGPHTTTIPGLIPSGKAALAEGLGWPLRSLARCWEEIAVADMGEADWNAPLIWLPKAIEHNEPESPNVVNLWKATFENTIPQCDLSARAEASLIDFLTTMGDAWRLAWLMGAENQYEEDKLRRWLRTNPALRQQIKARDGDLCRYCATPVSWTDRRGKNAGTYDHVDPRLGNDLENVATACRSCNSKKRRRTPEQAGMALLPPGSVLDLTQDGPRLEPGHQHPDPEPKPHPIKDLLAVHEQMFVARYNSKPAPYTGKDAKHAKDLIDRHGIDRSLQIIKQFFRSPDPFIVKSGHGLGILSSGAVQNRVIAELSTARKPSPTEQPASLRVIDQIEAKRNAS